jgi:hypothetical protein
VRRALLLSLAGSAVLAGFSVAALPFSRGLFRAPRTPYDASDAAFTVPAWILLERAEPLIPAGASVVVRVEPSDANTDSYLHRSGVALLPGRKVVPAALWGVPTPPEVRGEADYEIVVGRTTSSPGRRLVLSTPEGSVWKRDR